MKLSPKTRYAIRLLFELHAAHGPLSTASLSERTGLSFRTVEKIHAVLKRHGATEASVGARGGISLRRPLDGISLGHVVEWFENGVAFNVCCGEKAYECPQREVCANSVMWRHVSQRVGDALHDISLAKLVKQFPVAGAAR